MNTPIARLNIVVIFAIGAFIILTMFSNLAFISVSRQHQVLKLPDSSLLDLVLLPFTSSTPEETTPYFDMQSVKVLYYDQPVYQHHYSPIFIHNSYHFKQLLLGFDVDLDLRPLYTWGTKQIMVWIIVEYQTLSPLRGSTEQLFQPRLVQPSLISNIPGIGLSEHEQQIVDNQVKYVNHVGEALYQGKRPQVSYTRNRVVIWDAIFPIESYQESDFLLQNIESKYPVSEFAGEIDLSNVNIYIQWETTPLLGLFSVKGEQILHKAITLTPP